MKRFWKCAALAERDGGFGVTLDGRELKTPARVGLTVPGRALAEAIVAEWDDCGEEIDPREMPLTGLANAVVDRIAPAPDAFAATLTRYADADLLCYRAEGPDALVRQQAAAWDPLLSWARRRFDIDFVVGTGVIHIAQPPATVDRLVHALASFDPWRLAALSPLVTIGGSLVAALALAERAFPVDRLWPAVSLDERWQLEKWGSDAEAEAALEERRRDFFAAAQFLELLDA